MNDFWISHFRALQSQLTYDEQTNQGTVSEAPREWDCRLPKMGLSQSE
jgi:hypothetical protein